VPPTSDADTPASAGAGAGPSSAGASPGAGAGPGAGAAARPARGRPTEIDAAALARTAVALFAERGYDAVSMADVAEAAGIGRRSLFRYFPTKADLVWDGAEPVGDEMQRRLRSSPSGDDVLRAYGDAFVAGLAVPELDLVATRARLRIIAAHPELLTQVGSRMGSRSATLAAFIAERRPDLVGTVRIGVLADALSAATYAALRWWAVESDDERPDAAIREALEALADLARPTRAS